jgi:hypothetical protein
MARIKYQEAAGLEVKRGRPPVPESWTPAAVTDTASARRKRLRSLQVKMPERRKDGMKERWNNGIKGCIKWVIGF